ncbi:MAG: thrombospondin type 3 repeat-containing protein [Desulfuromonadales bacterium]|jgi:OOP family OmpA-OmpF porin
MRTFLLLLACLQLLAAAATAQNYPSLSAATGLLSGLDDAADRSLLVGAKAGYWWGGKNARESLGLEGVVLAGGSDVYLLRADALYQLLKAADWQSFLTVGFGTTNDSALVAYGAAAAYQPDTPIFLRLDLRQLQTISADRDTGWEAGLQLGYAFGYERKPRPQPRPDADGDGVPDAFDRCADTPQELPVDRRGCPQNPPDADGDHIPDYLDRCPETPLDMRVEPDGCPADSDGDGIPDVEDRCPHNPPGLAVDADGCVRIRD